MKEYLKQKLMALKRRIKYSLLAQRSIAPWIPNEFVYSACRYSKMHFPDIPVGAVEHYSQCGEDLIVRGLLKAIAMRTGISLKEKLFLEVGGNHAFATSSSYLLSRTCEMKGAIVEANEKLIPDLKRGRPNDEIIYGAVQDQDVTHVAFSISNLSEISSIDSKFVANWGQGRSREVTRIQVPALRMNDLLGNRMRGDDVVYLSIDVEGMDLLLLKDIDFARYRPWIVQAEPSDYHILGNSKSICEYMDSVGYQLMAATDVNLIFCDRKIV